jgi:serine/threonine-protein kinase HipA
MTVARRGRVALDGRPIGWLDESPDARFVTFSYDPDYLTAPDAVPISLTIPLSRDPLETWGLHPFFRNLLPEGWLRALAVAKLKVAEDDELGLLLATGADCAGAVEITALDNDQPAAP